jgi:FkbM family methyltransferase
MNLHDLYQAYTTNKIEKHAYIKAMHENHSNLFEYADFIKDTDVESICINNGNLVITIKGSGIELFVDRNDSRFIPIEILNFQSFDPVERDLIMNLANQSECVFDIGANIGWYSLNFNLLSNIKKIFAFEPIPHTYSYLKQHIELNGSNKVIANNFALSNENGEISFYWNENETGSSSMKNIQDRDNAKIINCKTQTLDSYAKEQSVQVDMIKCDVEGSELLVFQGGLETIARDKPFIFTEMLRKWSAKFGYHPNDIINLLVPLGYRCFAFEKGKIQEYSIVTDETLPTNYFFFHEIKHQKVISSLKC